jgi:hypothetical protein
MSEFQTIYIHTFEKNGRKPTLKERAEMRKCCGPYQWTPTEPGKGRGFYQSSRGLRCGDSTFDLRLEEANDHVDGRLSHINGYYCDEQGDGDTLMPIIARLPHGHGFLAGWTMGAGMCASIASTIYADIEDAARAAHDMAAYDAQEMQDSHAMETEEEAK